MPSQAGLKPWQRPGLLLFGAVHLGLALACAANLPLAGYIVRSRVAPYGSLSGVNTRFGFFAPSVGTQLKARFSTVDSGGREQPVELSQNAGRESALRRDNIIATFWFGLHDDDLARSVTSSWAARVFAQHPAAQTVKVGVDIYDLPSMSGWREGRRPDWKTIYEASYQR